MPAVESSGSQTCVISTEHTLATAASHKTRVLTLDMVNAAYGDVFEVRVSQPISSGGTNREQWKTVFGNTLTSVMTQAPPVVMMTGGTFTIKQTAGTGRVVPWRVDTLD